MVNVRLRVILEFELVIGIDDPGIDFLGCPALDGLFNHALEHRLKLALLPIRNQGGILPVGSRPHRAESIMATTKEAGVQPKSAGFLLMANWATLNNFSAVRYLGSKSRKTSFLALRTAIRV